MYRRLHSLLLLSALAAPTAAQPPEQPTAQPAAQAPKDDIVSVALDTSAGRIVIALDRGHAPVTVRNFLAYVDSGKFNGESFYRAMPLTGGGLVQAGITSDARKLGRKIAHEPPTQTGLHHIRGAVSMAATAPGEAQSDFFILTTDVPAFDEYFAPFGRVVEGMDVVENILSSPVSATKGEGVMKGQMLDPVVKIKSAKRLP